MNGFPVREGPRLPSRLYHFTCEHGADGIETVGAVLPLSMIPGVNLAALPEEQLWRADLIWLTDDPNPSRESLGLMAIHLTCDRLYRRYEVEPPDSTRWWPSRIAELGPIARAISLTPGSAPGRWWVAPRPARVLSFA